MTALPPHPELLEFALQYAERGIPVQPGYHISSGACACNQGRACGHPAKHPRHIEGKAVPFTTDPSVISNYWGEWPWATVRLQTGDASGLLLLDIDRHGPTQDGFARLAEFEERYGMLRPTWTYQTTSGEHRLFRFQSTTAGSHAQPAGLNTGLELHYGKNPATAPPSWGIDGDGKPREWRDGLSPFECEAAPAPEWLTRFLDAPPKETEGASDLPPWALDSLQKRFEAVSYRGQWASMRCSIPENHTHGDRTPSAYGFVNGKRLYVKCHRECLPDEMAARAGLTDAERQPGKEPTDPDRFLSIALSAPDFLAREYPRPRSILGDGIFCVGEMGILYGKPGSGKTWAALQFAHCAARGEPWFGIETGGEPLRVGILELELHAIRIQDRLRALGIEDRDLGLRIIAHPDLAGRVNILDDSDFKALEKWCRDDSLNLLVADAVSRLHQIDENQGTEMGKVLSRFDDLRHTSGTAPLLIHHEPKTSGQGRRPTDDMDALRGSSRLASDPTFLLRLVKLNGGLRSLRFVKASNAQEPEPLFLKQAESGILELTEPPAKQSAANRKRVLQALLQIGKDGAHTGDIAKESELKDSATRGHLVALEEEGKVRRGGTGKSTRWFPCGEVEP